MAHTHLGVSGHFEMGAIFSGLSGKRRFLQTMDRKLGHNGKVLSSGRVLEVLTVSSEIACDGI